MTAMAKRLELSEVYLYMRKNKTIIMIIILLLAVVAVGVSLLIPSEPVMLTVPEYNQHPDYPTGCESASLYMLLRYYGVDVTMEDIVDSLKKGPLPYEENGVTYGANPEKEFVGNPKDSSSYGVFNEPIRDVAEKFKSGAKTMTSADLGDIEKIISSGNPVIAWYTTNVENGISYRREWLDYETGETVKWPSYEHAVVIYGYDDNNIFYNDPNTGSGMSMSKSHFRKAFEQLGSRIVYYDDPAL